MKRSLWVGLVVFMVWLCLLFAIRAFAVTDVAVGEPAQIGDRLPSPYECLSYQGHNSVLALWPIDCPNKTGNWLYVDANNQGEYVFKWDIETLVLKPIGKAQVQLYRRLP